MEIRDARPGDSDGIGRVAAASLRASYADVLDDDEIEAAVEGWYAPERVTDLLNEEETFWKVAEDDGEIVGFAQGAMLDTDPLIGEIHWLHVAPDAREAGLARQLLGAAQERVEKRGGDRLQGDVIAGNEDGTAFYEAHGFDRVDEREVTVGDEAYTEYVYEKALGETAAEAVVEKIDGPEDDLFVSFSEGERGTDAPFYATYRTRELAERYGWYCSNCESVSTAMDSMGRIECNDCGNTRKATRWDQSYL